MQQRKLSHRQIGVTKKCLLCNNDFCNKHESEKIPDICEMEHETYCRKAAHQDRHAPFRIFSSLEERDAYIARYGQTWTAGSTNTNDAEIGDIVG